MPHASLFPQTSNIFFLSSFSTQIIESSIWKNISTSLHIGARSADKQVLIGKRELIMQCEEEIQWIVHLSSEIILMDETMIQLDNWKKNKDILKYVKLSAF